MQGDSPILDEFRRALERAKLSPVAISHYVGVVRRGLLAGDMLIATREARSPSAAKLARAGLLRWARWRKDKTLAVRIPGVPYLPERPPERRCTPEMRAQLLDAIAYLAKDERPVFEIALRSAVKIGTLLDLPRKRVVRTVGVPEETIDALRAMRGWKVFGDLLGPSHAAAYAVYRRRLIFLCEKAKVAPLRPNDLRLLADQEMRAQPTRTVLCFEGEEQELT